MTIAFAEDDLSLRVHLIRGTQLASKDRNGLSDPYVILSLGLEEHQSSVSPGTLEPSWDETFDFSFPPSQPPKHLGLVCWDKDRFGRDFMGRFRIPLADLLLSTGPAVEPTLQTNATPRAYTLESRKDGATVSGSITLKAFLLPSKATGSLSLPAWRRAVTALVGQEKATALFPATQAPALPPRPVAAGTELSRNASGEDSGYSVKSPPSSAMPMPMPTPYGANDIYADDPYMFKVANSLGNMRIDDKPTVSDTFYSPSSSTQATAMFPMPHAQGTVTPPPSADEMPIGTMFLDIMAAESLPPLPNALKTGFDMDPFCVITFARQSFRTRALHHTLEARWKERLYFPITTESLKYPVRFGIFDYDKFSDNDHVGFVEVPIAPWVEQAASSEACSPDGWRDSAIPLTMVHPDFLTHSSTLHVRSCFLTHEALRRRFWHALAKQYDVDSNGMMSGPEVETMLDSLGSTLSDETIAGFFRSCGRDAPQGELSFDQLSSCLETFLSEHGHTPTHPDAASSVPEESGEWEDSTDSSQDSASEPEREMLISVRVCPVCHKYGTLGRTDLSAVTHIATCSMHDPVQIDRFIMSNAVSESYAQRKWFTKVVNKFTFGGYGLGKNNANILVLDRASGQIIEEKIATYVRLGIRLMYKSSSVSGARVRSTLESLSRKQGLKYDAPSSKADIAPFIAFHHLDIDEILDPLDSFHTFNQFFYRKLKPEARPFDAPNDPSVLLSPADARCMFFPTIDAARSIWIKGTDFSLEKLLAGDTALAQRYVGGSLAIFRLAPQDYHRFHVPADGTFSEPRPIPGAYYTVNPMAVRSTLDIYGDNLRTISILESPQFGSIVYIAIGAMMVGSTLLTSTPGAPVKRGDEHGYFAFGGSTCLLLFEPGRITFDKDLLENSGQALETLLKMGNRVGVANP